MSSDTSKTPGDFNQDLTLVFVYGSLKRGYALHSVLANQRFLGKASSTAEYRLFDCGHYPALVKVPDNGKSVDGEVYEVDQNCLAKLDEVEGTREGLYARQTIFLLPPDHFPATEAYFYLRSVHGLKDCGQNWPIANP